MNIDLVRIDEKSLNKYAEIPIHFQIISFLEITFRDNGFSGINITEKPIAKPYLKNYDQLETPLDWPEKWDLKNWGIFIAKNEYGENTGGVAIAYNTPDIEMLEGRSDISVLWDIRVNPEHRGKGTGKLLFEQAVRFSRDKGCKKIKIETQNNNVNACRFYSAQGCYLGGIHPGMYAEFPDEIQLLWYKDLLTA